MEWSAGGLRELDRTSRVPCSRGRACAHARCRGILRTILVCFSGGLEGDGEDAQAAPTDKNFFFFKHKRTGSCRECVRETSLASGCSRWQDDALIRLIEKLARYLRYVSAVDIAALPHVSK